ncbi:membrane protein BRI3 [Lycorma delicatula]|uniref:membrane protein BRI3 n=1 Tax=Lycorma delicatula TaxID=130591 RepID=UPI003F5176C8
MSKPSDYDKPPPYSPHPQEQVHPTYFAGYQSYPPAPPLQSALGVQQQPATYQPFPSQPVSPANYGATTVTIQPQEIIIIGTCPACRVGVVEDDYPCLAILCAIFFFPIGILFCLLLKDRRCSNCGAYFG